MAELEVSNCLVGLTSFYYTTYIAIECEIYTGVRTAKLCLWMIVTIFDISML